MIHHFLSRKIYQDLRGHLHNPTVSPVFFAYAILHGVTDRSKAYIARASGSLCVVPSDDFNIFIFPLWLFMYILVG